MSVSEDAATEKRFQKFAITLKREILDKKANSEVNKYFARKNNIFTSRWFDLRDDLIRNWESDEVRDAAHNLHISRSKEGKKLLAESGISFGTQEEKKRNIGWIC